VVLTHRFAELLFDPWPSYAGHIKNRKVRRLLDALEHEVRRAAAEETRGAEHSESQERIHRLSCLPR
jgi:hypothetical protein